MSLSSIPIAYTASNNQWQAVVFLLKQKSPPASMPIDYHSAPSEPNCSRTNSATTRTNSSGSGIPSGNSSSRRFLSSLIHSLPSCADIVYQAAGRNRSNCAIKEIYEAPSPGDFSGSNLRTALSSPGCASHPS